MTLLSDITKITSFSLLLMSCGCAINAVDCHILAFYYDVEVSLRKGPHRASLVCSYKYHI